MKKIISLLLFLASTFAGIAQSPSDLPNFRGVRFATGATESGRFQLRPTIIYNTSLNKFRVYENGTWKDLVGGGITNTAAANEFMKSNGTNSVPSGLFSTAAGDLTFGTGLAGGVRTLLAEGSASDVGFNIRTKGTNGIILQSSLITLQAISGNSHSVDLAGSASGTYAGYFLSAGTTAYSFLGGNAESGLVLAFNITGRGGGTANVAGAPLNLTAGKGHDLSGNAAGGAITIAGGAGFGSGGGGITNINGGAGGTTGAGGNLNLSSGTGATSTGNTQITTGNASAGNSGNVIISTGTATGTKGNIQLQDNVLISLTKGLQIAEGTNATKGQATLVAGTVTVSTTQVLTASKIFLSVHTAGGTQGFLRISALTNATSFVITSTSGTETSTVNWLIIN